MVSINRTGLLLNLEMGNNNGTNTVFDTSSRGFDMTETGTITFVEGQDGYIESNNAAGTYIGNTTGGIFGDAALTFAIKFTPDFDPTSNDTYVFTNTSGSRYFIAKLPNGNANVIRLQFADSVGNDISLANYQDYWKTGEENILIIRTNSAGGAGGTTTYLNGTLVNTSTAAWTPAADTEITIAGHSSQGFDGKMFYFRVWNRLLTADEITRYSADRKTDIDVTKTTNISSAPRAGLIGYWNMDDNDINGTTVYDKSGNGYNGTLVGSPTTGLEGVRRQAFQADDGGKYIELDNGISTKLAGVGAFTTTFFFKILDFNLTGSSFGGILGIGSAANRQIWVYMNKATEDITFVSNIDGNNETLISPSLSTDVWYMCVLRYDGATFDYKLITLDDSVIGTDSRNVTGNLTIASSFNFIGFMNDFNQANAVIDEVRIYNTALTDSQVTNAFNARRITHVN